MSRVEKSTPSMITVEELDEIIADWDVLSSPSVKTTPRKRQADTEVHYLSDTNETGAKKKKLNEIVEFGKSQQKILNVMAQQLGARKQINENMLKNFSDVIKDFEEGFKTFEQKGNIITSVYETYLKCMRQSTTIYKENVESIKEVRANFKKRCEDLVLQQQGAIVKMGKELEEEISQFKQKLVQETRREEWVKMQEAIMKAAQDII